jgi:hypothetical protein
LPVLALLACLAVAATAAAQALPSLALLRVIYNSTKTRTAPQGDLKVQIDDVDRQLAEAFRTGRAAEARRLLAKGMSLLGGRP